MYRKIPQGAFSGWPSHSIIPLPWCLALAGWSASAESHPSISVETEYDLIAKALFALGGVIFAQAIIPLIRFFHQKRSLRKTYRSYLKTHVDTTLLHFQGAGSTHFARRHLLCDPGAEWLKYLQKYNLGVPEVFIGVQTIIDEALANDTYIPSVSYFGPDGHPLDPASSIWELGGVESRAALDYFITQQQLEMSLNYQYQGWYFDLIKSGNKSDRARWCKGLESTLYDLARHYHASRLLKLTLDVD